MSKVDLDDIVGFDEGEVDPGKGFEGTRVESLDEWNRLAMEQAEGYNEADPFERKEQRVRLRTRVKLFIRNKIRSRKLGIDV